ncbi:hypothetical protein ILUMI_27055 [Ignelater luminosus]|uniref:PiggyBac transposable element-derived protein domain-containing protein n=1 Tax=Ignelater luminosus TaxID=2038154 RepID=A0A8K0C5N4_IGNLU|nr:hypothetical protein ILUMI_27055 [Ignelater luminosus]
MDRIAKPDHLYEQDRSLDAEGKAKNLSRIPEKPHVLQMFMKREADAGAPMIPLSRVQQLVSAATGISLRIINRIAKEGREIEKGEKPSFSTPNKIRKNRKSKSFFELWLPTLQHSYIPYENLTVYEQLLTFRGRCPFKHFIPSKPEKYGIKIWAACDSQASFVYNCQIYIGKTGDQHERNQGRRVVLDMTKGLETLGRNVTTDNFFTSLDLTREMEKKNSALLDTIRKTKPELPQELVTTRGRDVYSTKLGYQDKAVLASYCPKKRENRHLAIDYA